MLRLKKLIFKNVGRFIAEQAIDFNDLDSLIQIDAQNNNTGGSSGSGKSTIFNALDWLLGLSDLSTSILQSRLTKELISVTGHFDWDGKDTVIQRAKKLSITVDGIETTGSSKLTEELLDQILGMDRGLFRPLLHKRQGEQGFFLQMTPSKMNEFLTGCLGLSSISSKIDIIDQKIKEASQHKLQSQNDLQALQAALKATQEALESLGLEPTSNITEEIFKGHKIQYENWKDHLNKKEILHKEEKQAIESKKPKLTTVPFDKTYFNEIEKEIKNIELQINTILDNERVRQNKTNQEISSVKLESANQSSSLKSEYSQKLNEINNELTKLRHVSKQGDISKTQAIKLAGQIKIIRSGLCAVCEQSWITEKAKLEEQRLLEELDGHKKSIEAASKANQQISTLESTVNDINVHYNAQISILTEKFKTQLIELNEQLKPQILPELPILNEKLRNAIELKEKEKEKEHKHNSEQNSNNQNLMEVFLSEQKALLTKHAEEIKDIRNEMEYSKSQYEKNQNEFNSHKEALARHKNTSVILKNKEAETISKIDHMNQTLVRNMELLEVAEEVKRCLKSYLSCSFDDALDSISDTATKILRAVPTMSNATVRLEGTKETNSGAIKEQVTAFLDNDGELEIPIKSLSGGERSAVDLAIDLAVCEMIQEKANKGIDIMVLDEPFNGFDSVGIENALDMLKTFATNKKILLVEHDSVAKEFIQNRITIIRDGETSYIK